MSTLASDLHIREAGTRRGISGLVADAVVGGTLLLSANAFLPLRGGAVDAGPSGSVFNQAIFVAAYAAALLLLRRHVGRALRTLTAANPPLLILLGLALVSTAWSGDQHLTARRSVALILASVVGAAVGVSYNASRFTRTVAIAAGLSAVSSVGAAVLIPSKAYREPHHTFVGVFGHKNQLALMMAIGVLCAWRQWRESDRRSPRWLVLAAVLIFVMLIANGLTPLFSLLACAAGALIATVSRRDRNVAVGVVCIAASLVLGVALLGAISPASLLGHAGRSTTLSGRTLIWTSALHSPAAELHRTFGVGYSAFWRNAPGAPGYDLCATELARSFPEGMPHDAHSDPLEILLDLGFVGEALLLLTIACALRSARRSRWLPLGPERALGFAFLGFILVYSTTEAALFEQNSLMTILFASVVVRLGVVERHSFEEAPSG